MRLRWKMPSVLLGGLQVGAGSTNTRQILSGTVSVNPPSINANTSANVDVTVSGLATNMIVFVTPPADLEDDLEFRGVSIPSANTLRLRLRNNNASTPVDGAARTWHYLALLV